MCHAFLHVSIMIFEKEHWKIFSNLHGYSILGLMSNWILKNSDGKKMMKCKSNIVIYDRINKINLFLGVSLGLFEALGKIFKAVCKEMNLKLQNDNFILDKIDIDMHKVRTSNLKKTVASIWRWLTIGLNSVTIMG